MKSNDVTKRSYHHGNLRETLLANAKDMLANEGAQSLSLRKLAKQAGVSAPAVYSHFADKRELLAYLAADGYQLFTASMRKELPKQAAEEKDYLRGLARGYVYFAVDHPALFQLMFSSELGDLSLVPELATASSESYQLLEELVQRQLEHSQSIVPKAIATTACWSIVHGLANLINEKRIALETVNVESLENLVNEVCDMICF